MSDKPIMILVYLLLVLFALEIAWLFYGAYIRDRRKL